MFHLATLSLSDLLVEVFQARDGVTGQLEPIEIEIVIENDSLTVEQARQISRELATILDRIAA